MKYDCQNSKHMGGVDLSDELFPTSEQAKAGMNPEVCVQCNEGQV